MANLTEVSVFGFCQQMKLECFACFTIFLQVKWFLDSVLTSVYFTWTGWFSLWVHHYFDNDWGLFSRPCPKWWCYITYPIRVTQAELNLKWNPSGTLKYLFIYLLGEYLIFNGDQVKSFQSSCWVKLHNVKWHSTTVVLSIFTFFIHFSSHFSSSDRWLLTITGKFFFEGSLNK